MKIECLEVFVIAVVAAVILGLFVYMKLAREDLQETYFNQCIAEDSLSEFECRATAIEMTRPNS